MKLLEYIKKTFSSACKKTSSIDIPRNLKAKQRIINEFHKLYYETHSDSGFKTYWQGIRVLKCPLDLWVYQEIIYSLRPDLIIETGTKHGGSALYFASIFDLLSKGRIISIDVKHREIYPAHKRIEYITGSSVSKEIVSKIDSLASNFNSILVSLDSDHSANHVLKELEIYSKYVTPGSYLIVEDTNVGYVVNVSTLKSGPMEAVNNFLKKNKDFEIDRDCERYLMTFNPSGFLRKKVK